MFPVRVNKSHFKHFIRTAIVRLDNSPSWTLNAEVLDWLLRAQIQDPDLKCETKNEHGPVIYFSNETTAIAFKLIFG